MTDTNNTASPQFGKKLALLSCVIALLTAALISGFYVFRTSEITLKNAMNNLVWQTRLLVPNFKSGFLQMQNDAFILSHFPAIRDYARFENSKEELLARKRTPETLTPIITNYFKTMIEIRPHYRYLRLISADTGKELIRVNRTTDGAELIPPDQLQNKKDEPYFKDALSLKEGQSYFSTVSQRREFGQPYPTKQITIRHVVPIMDGTGKLFGLIVINADYEALLQTHLDNLTTKGSIFVINDAGDYTLVNGDKKFKPLQFHGSPDYVAHPLVQKIMASPTDMTEARLEQRINGVDKIIYYIKIPFDSFSNNANGRFLGIAFLESKDNFMADHKEILRQSMILAFIAICLSPFLALPLAKTMQKHIEYLLVRLTASKASERKALIELEAIIENAVDGLITINTRGIIQSVNPACEKMFGYKADDLIGQNLKMLMPEQYARHHDEYLDNYINTRIPNVIGVGREVEGRKKSGEIFPVDVSVSEINMGENIFYSGIIRDISERKKAENLLKSSNLALIKSNAELDDFAYIASHDLKEPLRAIYNHTRFMMEDYGDELPEGAKARMNKLLDVSLRMDKLIDDLLNFSRLSRDELSRETHNMNELVQDAIKNIEPYLEEMEGKIFVEPNLPPVACDRVRIISVFQNLIVNALKYNDHNEKTIRIGYKATHIYNGTVQTDVYFVQDNGIGIDAKFKDSVFRIFKRLNSPKIYGDGTGSGLTFAKKNIERHGGTIWFESVVGEGSIFYFTLKEKTHV